MLEESPGSLVKPPAPVPHVGDIVNAAKDYVDNVLPLVAKQNAVYDRREARLAKGASR